MKKILIPTDFSAPAQRAIHYAVRLFAATDAEFILVHAYQIPNAGQHVLISLDDLLREEAERDMAEQRNLVIRETGIDSARVKTALFHGSVVTGVHRIAHAEGADLVVMGTVGASGVLEKFMGSNAAAVIRELDIPVIAVPHNAPVRIPHRVALATDAQESPAALSQLQALTELWGAGLYAFHVQTGEPEMEAAETGVAEQKLGSLEQPVATVHHTSVEAGMDHYVRSNNVDMLALTPQKRGVFARLFNRSVSRSMSMKTSVPLLVLRD